jgi:hypothetical protein
MKEFTPVEENLMSQIMSDEGDKVIQAAQSPNKIEKPLEESEHVNRSFYRQSKEKESPSSRKKENMWDKEAI